MPVDNSLLASGTRETRASLGIIASESEEEADNLGVVVVQEQWEMSHAFKYQ